MTRRRQLLAMLAVPAALLVSLPLHWPAERMLSGLAMPVSALEASGTLWSGSLRGVRWREAALGDVMLRLQPLALLRGQARVHLQGDGWSLAGARGLRHGIVDAQGRLPLPFGLPGDAATLVLEAQALTVLFDAGHCRQATGQVHLQIIPTDATRPPAILSGRPSCAGDAMVLDLVDDGGDTAPGTAHLRIDHAGRYQLDVHGRATGAAQRLALQLSGFDPAPDGGFTRTIAGRLGR